MRDKIPNIENAMRFASAIDANITANRESIRLLSDELNRVKWLVSPEELKKIDAVLDRANPTRKFIYKCCDDAPHPQGEACRIATPATDLGEGKLACTCGTVDVGDHEMDCLAYERQYQQPSPPQDLGGGFCPFCKQFIGGYNALQAHRCEPMEKSLITSRQSACLNGEHVAAVVCECGSVEPIGESHLHRQINATPHCRHCRVVYVPREA